MTEDLAGKLSALDALPDDPPRSRLEPYRSFILRWRREGRSYERIRQILREECHVEVAHATLFKFVKLRSRPRKPQPDLQINPLVQPLSSSEAGLPVARKPRMSNEERKAQADALRAQFAKPALPAKPEDTRPLFDYDPDKPLTLVKPKEK